MAAPLALVTGASGYVASHLIDHLLSKGFRVRGTVRSVADPTKVSHLTSRFPTLELFEADLLVPGTFDSAVEGCDYVFHTASPFQLVVEDPQRDLVDPALKGTQNVLSSVRKYKDAIKRVVVTSSVAAIVDKPREGHVFTEEDWNLVSTVDFEPYRFSKRIAEEEAWNFAKETGVSLVTVNPSLVLGPPLSSRVDSFSVGLVKGFLEGKFKESGAKASCFGCVDVRDVAAAHFKVATIPEAKGRYMVTSEKGISHLQLAQILHRNGFEAYPLPDKEESPVVYVPQFSTKKAREELHLEFTPIEKSLVDMANALLELKIVTPLANA
jgi:nucleoside-diphosphate-sugar epimerase